MKTDKEIIDIVAGDSTSYTARVQALDQINDSSIFQYLAENAKDDWIKLESAVRGKITNSLQSLKNHPDERICLEAAIELDDQQRLAEIVLDSQDQLLKEIAANYIDSDEVLREILLNAKDEKSKVIAVMRLGDCKSCRRLLTELKSENLLFKLAQFIGDQGILKKLSLEAKDDLVKEKAADWLSALSDADEDEID
jgi:hypothetical protein